MHFQDKINYKGIKAIIFDFDGVISESVKIKSDAFALLYADYSNNIIKKVVSHHEANGGVSRFKKIPLYLDWAGESVNPFKVREFCDRFSKLVQQAVIDSPWVPGVKEYLNLTIKMTYWKDVADRKNR